VGGAREWKTLHALVAFQGEKIGTRNYQITKNTNQKNGRNDRIDNLFFRIR